MENYIALLRGINVGGNNLIKMEDLRAVFTSLGFSNVRTYIQSGNILFSSAPQDPAALTKTIETTLSAHFGYDSRVCLVRESDLKSIVTDAPEDFGKYPEKHKYDVYFLLPPLNAVEAARQIKARLGVDLVVAGKGVVYSSRLISRIGQSDLKKMIGTPLARQITIRNWNTTTRLLKMTDASVY